MSFSDTGSHHLPLESILHGFLLELPGIQVIVSALLCDQFRVGSLLNDLTVMHHQDHIRLPDGRKSMRNHKRGAPFHQMLDGILDQLLGHGID